MILTEKTLLFSIATNGYDDVYRAYLDSHQSYAQKHGYKYVVFTKSPPCGITGTNSAWLKVAVVLKALHKGYDNIFFIDSDAFIKPHTPAMSSVFRPGKSVYMSVTSSGRFNSGVIIIRNCAQSVRFFERLLLRADVPGFFLPKSDRCLYENGHVINLAKSSPIVETIDPKWNYNSNTKLNDGETEYIMHGRDSWEKKPRSKAQPLTILEAVKKRMNEGPRYLLLKRLVEFYEHEYSF